MSTPRSLPLLDLKAQPQSWNERMTPGEFAVLYAGVPEDAPLDSTTCLIFDSFDDAVNYATEQISLWPELRCRIYNHNGFGSEPLREIRGKAHVGDSEITASLRRWGGSILFFGGALLTGIDWALDFRLLWASMLGVRMMPVGLVLLVTELVIQIDARRKKRPEGSV